MPHVRSPVRPMGNRPLVHNVQFQNAQFQNGQFQNGQFQHRIPTPRLTPPRILTPNQALPPMRNRLPQFLPVLQPPMFPREIFPREYDLYEEEQYPPEFEMYQTVPLMDQHRPASRRLSTHNRPGSSLRRYARPSFSRHGRHTGRTTPIDEYDYDYST
ncbi:unnamed protein product [Adineta steineri]|uniref:Uncharacterized protein n=1 Tax=Adineta steineri TaxID=433720 RepID=A0A815CMP8_9BILA|nr:unnamed protein product [Adineta steineri]CAF3597505.1 unnamed protein product [Adineta steineri]